MCFNREESGRHDSRLGGRPQNPKRRPEIFHSSSPSRACFAVGGSSRAAPAPSYSRRDSYGRCCWRGPCRALLPTGSCSRRGLILTDPCLAPHEEVREPGPLPPPTLPRSLRPDPATRPARLQRSLPAFPACLTHLSGGGNGGVSGGRRKCACSAPPTTSPRRPSAGGGFSPLSSRTRFSSQI